MTVASKRIEGRKTINIEGGSHIRVDDVVAPVWQNPNGTWSHGMDAKREWADKVACETDLQFAKEWQG